MEVIMYTVNIKTISRSKNMQSEMKQELKDLLLNCKNFKELRSVFKNNSLMLREILNINLFPDSIQKRVELLKIIKEGKEHEIKINSVLKGMFIKIEIML
jgi:hypothetical protein